MPHNILTLTTDEKLENFETPTSAHSKIDIKINAIVTQLDDNYSFFSTILNGQFGAWFTTLAEDKKKNFKEQVENFDKGIKGAFINGNTNDPRNLPTEVPKDPWGCFAGSIVGIKDEGLRYSEWTNQYYESLKNFLNSNVHIANFLDQGLPTLNKVVKLWETEQFDVITEPVIKWFEQHLDFFKSLYTDTIYDWMETKHKEYQN